MNKLMHFISIIGVFSLLLTACSSSGGGGKKATEIVTTTAGAAATGSGTSASTAGTAITDVATELGGLSSIALGKPFPSKPANPWVSRDGRYSKMTGMAQKVSASTAVQKAAVQMKAGRMKSKTAFATVEITFTDECPHGGSLTVNGSIDDTSGALDFSLDFDNCREGNELMDGTISMSGTFDFSEGPPLAMDSDIKLTFEGFTLKEFVEDVLDVTLAIDMVMNQTLSTTFSETLFDMSFDLETDGTLTYDEAHPSGVDLTLIANKLRDKGSFSVSDSAIDADNTLNGQVSVGYVENSVAHEVDITYGDFIVTITGSGVFLATSLSHDEGGSLDITFDGTVTTDFTPDADCETEGTFTFVTETPLHIGSDEESCPVSGRIVINDTTEVDFNSDGSMDVTVGDQTEHYESCNELDSVCSIDEIDEL